MNDLPEIVYIGKRRGQWPLRIFENEAHALHWLEEAIKEDNLRYPPQLFRTAFCDVVQMEFVPPSRPGLRPVTP